MLNKLLTLREAAKLLKITPAMMGWMRVHSAVLSKVVTADGVRYYTEEVMKLATNPKQMEALRREYSKTTRGKNDLQMQDIWKHGAHIYDVCRAAAFLNMSRPKLHISLRYCKGPLYFRVKKNTGIVKNQLLFPKRALVKWRQYKALTDAVLNQQMLDDAEEGTSPDRRAALAIGKLRVWCPERVYTLDNGWGNNTIDEDDPTSGSICFQWVDEDIRAWWASFGKERDLPALDLSVQGPWAAFSMGPRQITTGQWTLYAGDARVWSNSLEEEVM